MFSKKNSSKTVFNIDNKKYFSEQPNQYIRMISEESCDTENWSNGCWIFSFHHKNKLRF